MKKPLIAALVLIFVIAPIAAWAVVASKPRITNPLTDVKPATNQELLTAIKKDNADNQHPPVQEIVAVKHMEKWWYIVSVKLPVEGEDTTTITPMLISKFDNNPDNIKVVTEPGEQLPLHNISGGLGVPYDVIDELNKALAPGA